MNVNYLFNNEDDLAFYILNAVAHDFIHDFNQYKRMGKILQYIMGLVTPALGSQVTSQPIQTSMIQSINILESAYMSNPVGDVPQYEEEGSPDTQDEILELNSLEDVTTQSDIVANGDINIGTPQIQNTMNITENIPVIDMYNSQIEEISNDNIGTIDVTRLGTELKVVGGIVNENITNYNKIQFEIKQGYETRSTTRKLYLLQSLKDFVQETIFLIISKLQDGDTTSIEIIGGKKTKQIGGNAIDIIKKINIIDSIKSIIDEINKIKLNELTPLINVFEYIMYSFLNLSIPNISPLEILNNSLIEDNVSIFIIGQCNPTDIEKQAILSLTTLLSSSSDISSSILDKASEKVTPKFTPSKMDILNLNIQRNRAKSAIPYVRTTGPYRSVGGAFNVTEYQRNLDLFRQLMNVITDFKQTKLYNAYINTYNSADLDIYYENYTSFVNPTNLKIIKQIVGENTFNVKNNIIQKSYKNAKNARFGNRNYPKYVQDMFDTIKDLIITKTIEKYDDVVNRANGRLSQDIGDSSSSSLTPVARSSVQKISELLATKVLELTGMTTTLPAPRNNSQGDLYEEVNILTNVANGKGFTVVDDHLISYFIATYKNNPNIKINNIAIAELNARIRACNKGTCRVINNAIPISITNEQGNTLKESISNIVVCPTSSICDGMGSFGSCVPAKNKEFANMNFMISYPGTHGNSYYGQTNIKPDKSSVNINYGYNYKRLNLYNSIEIKLGTQPVVLEANYVFKTLINQIITIWKSQSSVTNIDGLWRSLYETDYFISILKLGSQKSVGDIFQEINSTLANAGYNQNVQNLIGKQTYGLMGDRPSGVRVIKLLKDAQSGKNPKASGGYIYNESSSILYFSSKTGGNKITRKRKYKITTRRRFKQTKRKNKYNRTK